MKSRKISGRRFSALVFASGIFALICFSCKDSQEITMQQLQMQIPEGRQTFSEEVLAGEITGIKIEHFAFSGPVEQVVQLPDGYVSLFIFISGKGTLSADSTDYSVTPESVAVPKKEQRQLQLKVPEGEVLHFVKFTRKLSEQDLEELNDCPEGTGTALYFARFVDCEPYTEKIKSPNTVSRTVLPAGIVPRVSLGTVEAPGPDEVGAHSHPMLDQLFLGLSENDVVVHADGASAAFGQYTLLHIPIGSDHGVSVGENKKMYYLWMDFFLTSEGEEWLKTHKPVSNDKQVLVPDGNSE